MRCKVIKLDEHGEEYFYSFLNGEPVGTTMPENGYDVSDLSDEELVKLGARLVICGFEKITMVSFVYSLRTLEIIGEQRFTRTNPKMLQMIVLEELEKSEHS